jgi:hypothetical protein
MPTRRERNEQAVSVIVGTLMLILVTVTAAAGLAVMVSQMQKDEMNRQSHIAAVKNEELKITGIRPVYGPNGDLMELNVTVLNLNTVDSKVHLIGIGDRTFPRNFTADGLLYNNTNAGYEIRAAAQGEISLNVSRNFQTDPGISRNSSLRIFLITSYYNTFENTFKAPNADFLLKIQNEDLGSAERDLVVLDGSASTDDGAIMEWTWSVYDNGVLLPPLHGKTARFVPSSVGPFHVRLTVTDDCGMQAETLNKSVPRSDRFFPATYLNATKMGNEIVVTVTDLNDQVVKDTVVTFMKFYDVHGNLSLSAYSAATDLSGKVNVTLLSGEGTIRVESGKIAPLFVPVKYSP